MPADSYIKFLMKIDENFREEVEKSEKEFLAEAIKVRNLLLEKLEQILKTSKDLKIRDIAQALQILNAEIRKSERQISKSQSVEKEEIVDDELAFMEKRLEALESEIKEATN